MSISLEKFSNFSGKWYANDDEENFSKNLSLMPKDWHYRFDTVFYNFNSVGYRCPELEDISWSRSILLLGDSVSMGVGVNEDERFSNLIEQEIKVPIVNLSIGGSSNQLILQNSFSLCQSITPKAVILIFTDPSRITLFKNNHTENIGSWIFLEDSRYSLTKQAFYETWIEENNADKQGKLSAELSKIVWENANVPVFCFQNYGDWTSDMGFTRLVNPIDFGRDLNHGGIESQKLWADQIIKELKNVF